MSDTVTLVRRVVESILNGGNLDLADQLFASDYVNHGGLIPELVQGPEAIKVAVALMRSAFPRVRIDIDDVVGNQHTVALRWTAHGDAVETDRLAGTFTLPGMSFLHLASDQVTESWTMWDTARAADIFGPLTLALDRRRMGSPDPDEH